MKIQKLPEKNTLTSHLNHDFFSFYCLSSLLRPLLLIEYKDLGKERKLVSGPTHTSSALSPLIRDCQFLAVRLSQKAAHFGSVPMLRL